MSRSFQYIVSAISLMVAVSLILVACGGAPSTTGSQPAGASPEERGKNLAVATGCMACHSTDGSQGAGPTWKGLAGSDVTLTDGTTAKADDVYLKESILQPNAKIVKGFQPTMPQNYRQKLSDDQISDIIAYIKSLK